MRRSLDKCTATATACLLLSEQHLNKHDPSPELYDYAQTKACDNYVNHWQNS